MITLITTKNAEQLREIRKNDVFNFRNTIVNDINGKTGTLVAYNLDTYEFRFKIGDEEVNVSSSYFRPRRVFEGDVDKLTPENAPTFQDGKGLLKGISDPEIYNVGDFKGASLDIAYCNAMEGKTLKFATETVANTLVWSSKKNRYYTMDSLMVVVTDK